MAKELDAMLDRHEDFAHKIEHFARRLERLVNKENMRARRAEARPGDRDDEIMQELAGAMRRERGNGSDDLDLRG